MKCVFCKNNIKYKVINNHWVHLDNEIKCAKKIGQVKYNATPETYYKKRFLNEGISADPIYSGLV